MRKKSFFSCIVTPKGDPPGKGKVGRQHNWGGRRGEKKRSRERELPQGGRDFFLSLFPF